MFDKRLPKIFLIMLCGVVLLSTAGLITAQQPTVTPTVTPNGTPTVQSTPNGTTTPAPSDDDDGYTRIEIIIEGPVEEININSITIYNIVIELDLSDDDLEGLQIGDILRVEGQIQDDDDDDDNDDHRIVVTAIRIQIIYMQITVQTGGGNAAPPPSNNSGGGSAPPPPPPSGGGGDDDDD